MCAGFCVFGAGRGRWPVLAPAHIEADMAGTMHVHMHLPLQEGYQEHLQQQQL